MLFVVFEKFVEFSVLRAEISTLWGIARAEVEVVDSNLLGDKLRLLICRSLQKPLSWAATVEAGRLS